MITQHSHTPGRPGTPCLRLETNNITTAGLYVLLPSRGHAGIRMWVKRTPPPCFLWLTLTTCFHLLWGSSTVLGYVLFQDEAPQFACGQLLEGDQGDILSPLLPEPYPPDVDCTWHIRARPGFRIHLVSQYFYVEYHRQCLWDYLIIQDDTARDSGRVIHCGTDDVNFLSTSNSVTVTFHSDVSGSDAGFKLHYETLACQSQAPSSCNVTLREEGEVTSPHYPHDYTASSVCFYHLVAPMNSKISLEFNDFEVETSPCTFDKLELFDGDPGDDLMGTYCGHVRPENVTSSGHVITIKLITDSSLQSRGFKASFQFLSPPTTPSTPATEASPSVSTLSPTAGSVDSGDGSAHAGLEHSVVYACNVTVTASESNVSSPGFPEDYPYSTLCITKLRSDIISTFVVRFLNFSIEDDEGCTFDFLTILPATNESSNFSVASRSGPGKMHGKESDQLRNWKKCGNDLDDPIVTWEGYGLDLVFRSDKSVTDKGYLAHVLITPVVTGPRCPDVCQNGGTCKETLLADGAVDWMCSCPDHYTGVLCDVNLRPSCDDIECSNGGVCADIEAGSVCVCPDGFAGEFCEQAVSAGEGGRLFFTKMAANMSISLGGSAILECAVNDEKVHVMWLFNDRILTNADRSSGVDVHPRGVVVIPEVKDEHSGRYTCMAGTSEDLVERSAWIELTEPCSLHVAKAPSNITVREGQAAMLECYVPDADVILWRKDGNLVTSGPRKRVLVNHYLVVNPVMEVDAGQYTCAARGANGCFSKSSAFLTVERTGHGRECGLARVPPAPQTGGSGRISSGREAPEKSAPWHVVIKEEKKDTTFCGGSLISSDTVLTAAHCVVQFEETFGYPFHPRHIQIYLGTHHCEGDNGIYSGLKSYVIHEHFNNTYFNNDVAVLKLDTPVTFSDDVMPICLERLDFVEEILKPGQLGTITGCGDRHAQGIPPTNLHQVQIPFVLREICQERASAVNTTFSQGMFCAGYARSMRGDACSGDSGGPYVIQVSGRSVQVGIVSWGVGCDRENHYGYYTHVAHYYDWIMEHM